MARIAEATPVMFEGNFQGLRIKDEKGCWYKISPGLLMNYMIGAKIEKATPKKRIYRHIEKLSWQG
jgi:hypothetical protein